MESREHLEENLVLANEFWDFFTTWIRLHGIVQPSRRPEDFIVGMGDTRVEVGTRGTRLLAVRVMSFAGMMYACLGCVACMCCYFVSLSLQRS